MYRPAVPGTPEEEQEKREHDEEEATCIWPYFEHDESNCETVDGVWGGTCARCDAELGEI